LFCTYGRKGHSPCLLNYALALIAPKLWFVYMLPVVVSRYSVLQRAEEEGMQPTAAMFGAVMYAFAAQVQLLPVSARNSSIMAPYASALILDTFTYTHSPPTR